MQQGSDKSGFHTNRNMVGTGVILHKVYEISCIIHKQPFRRPNMRIMPETRISSSQPVLWRVSVAGTLVAPWWHSGSVAEDRTGSGGAVPVLHYPALRCACVPVCCVLCVPVCVQGQRTSCGQQHGWFGTIGSLQAGGTRRAMAETPVVRDQD